MESSRSFSRAYARCHAAPYKRTILRAAQQSMNGGVFYTDQASEIIVDTQLPLPMPPQDALQEALRRCSDLVQRDMRYAHLVAGAAKMPMNMIWAMRNADELVDDVELAKLKSLAWNEFLHKRFLPAISAGGGEPQQLSDAAASMLEVVRDLNLRRRRFQIMGLHEQVEASEVQLVLHLCQAGIVTVAAHAAAGRRGPQQQEGGHSSLFYRSLANRYRRHDRLYEAFALAVGAFVCASAPYTLGAATTRYERDLQFEYKKHTTALFVYALRQHPGAPDEAAAYDEDYVQRISRLIVVSTFPPPPPGDPLSFLPSAPGDDGGHEQRKRCTSCCDQDLLLNAVTTAQAQAEKAERAAGKAAKDSRSEIEKLKENVEREMKKLRSAIDDGVKQAEHKFGELESKEANLKIAIKDMMIDWLLSQREHGSGDGDASQGSASGAFMQAVRGALQEDLQAKIEVRLRHVESNLTDLIRQSHSTFMSMHQAAKNDLDGAITRVATEAANAQATATQAAADAAAQAAATQAAASAAAQAANAQAAAAQAVEAAAARAADAHAAAAQATNAAATQVMAAQAAAAQAAAHAEEAGAAARAVTNVAAQATAARTAAEGATTMMSGLTLQVQEIGARLQAIEEELGKTKAALRTNTGMSGNETLWDMISESMERLSNDMHDGILAQNERIDDYIKNADDEISRIREAADKTAEVLESNVDAMREFFGINTDADGVLQVGDDYLDKRVNEIVQRIDSRDPDVTDGRGTDPSAPSAKRSRSTDASSHEDNSAAAGLVPPPDRNETIEDMRRRIQNLEQTVARLTPGNAGAGEPQYTDPAGPPPPTANYGPREPPPQ